MKKRIFLGTVILWLCLTACGQPDVSKKAEESALAASVFYPAVDKTASTSSTTPTTTTSSSSTPATTPTTPPTTTPPPTNTPPLTTTQPTTPPATTPPPTTPPPVTPKKIVTIEFVRTCAPVWSTYDYTVFFEETKYPLFAFYRYNALTKEYETLPPHTTPLSNLDLLNDKPASRLKLSVEWIKPEGLTQTQWEKSHIVPYIFEDTNQNGEWDESWYNVVGWATGFKAHRPPSTVRVWVMAGRNRTGKTDSDFCEDESSPLVLDLNGDGIRLSGPEESKVLFDLAGLGEAVPTGWTNGEDDAFLVRDLNGNGVIDSGAELFGNATALKNGAAAKNGFEALKELDENSDGQLSPEDAAWESLRVWLDADRNGLTDADELKTLNDVGLNSLSVDYSNVSEIDPFGNETRQRSVAQRHVNGASKTILLVDIWFRTLKAY